MAKRILTFDFKDDFKDLIEIEDEDNLNIACFLPKNKIASFYSLPYSKHAGVYFLINDRQIKYVGVAKQLANRLKNHDEDYWNELLIITSSNINRLADERNDRIYYLEKKFIEQIGIENLENSYRGNHSISETNKSTRCMLDKIIDFTNLLFKFFVNGKFTKKKTSLVSNDLNLPNKKRNNSKLLNIEFHYIVKKHNIDNKITCLSENNWKLQAGAKLKPVTADDNYAKNIISMRNKYKDFINNNITTKDITFSSANQAGMFMHGQCINTWTSFVTEDGLSMDDVAKG